MVKKIIFVILVIILIAINYQHRDAWIYCKDYCVLLCSVKPVAEYNIQDFKIIIYKENGVNISNLDFFLPITEQTIGDFSKYMRQHYPGVQLCLNKAEINKKLKIYFVSPATWEKLERFWRTSLPNKVPDDDIIVGIYWRSANKMFLSNNDILWGYFIIRHELFHYLADCYKIEKYLKPDTEADAYKF